MVHFSRNFVIFHVIAIDDFSLYSFFNYMHNTSYGFVHSNYVKRQPINNFFSD